MVLYILAMAIVLGHVLLTGALVVRFQWAWWCVVCTTHSQSYALTKERWLYEWFRSARIVDQHIRGSSEPPPAMRERYKHVRRAWRHAVLAVITLFADALAVFGAFALYAYWA